MAEFSAVGLPTRAKLRGTRRVVRAARPYLPLFRMTFAERPEATTSGRPPDRMVNVGQPTDSLIPRFLRRLKLFSVQHRCVPVQNKMAFLKGNPLLPHAAATASLLLLALLVLVPCAVLFSAVTPGSAPQEQRPRDLLGHLGHHRVVGGAGFVEVVAHAGQAGGSSGLLWGLGHIAGGAQRRRVITGGSAAHIALRRGADAAAVRWAQAVVAPREPSTSPNF